MYFVFDEETQTHKSFKRKANPFNPLNYIVMRGWKLEGQSRGTMEYFKSKEEVVPVPIPAEATVLVGHNLKFDLLYEMCVKGGYENLQDFYNRGGTIWCTQYAQYLLNAQEQKYHMCAMDDIIESYGGRKKIDGIKALWEQGVLTSDINPDMLEDYLIGTEEEGRNSGDIGNTELIYRGQVQAAKLLGMYDAILRRMDGLLATTEMEFNGLKVDVAAAKEDMRVLQAEETEVQARLEAYIREVVPEEVQFSWTSNVHISCLLFGGTIKYEKREPYLDETGQWARLKATADWPLLGGVPVDPQMCAYDETLGLYQEFGVENADGTVTEFGKYQDKFLSGTKKGQPKFKKVAVPGELKIKWQDFFFTLPGITEPEPDWKGALVDGAGGPVYSTDKKVVEVLGTRDIPFLKDYSRNAALSKELGTYYARYDTKKKEYVGMLTCVDPATHIVHHSLNHTNTVTTRMSANNPNMQNLPRADKSRVKRMFVSRFGADGEMLEIDYSQLEVVVQGLLSGDPNLIRDLNSKIDFHCKRVALKHGISYEEAVARCKDENHPEYKFWKGERTKAKNFSFQR